MKNTWLVCASWGAVYVDVVEKRAVDVHLDFIEGDNWPDRSPRATFLEFEDTQYLQLFQICMNIGDVAVDESCSLPHT